MLPPRKCVLPLKCPPKFRDLAPPLFRIDISSVRSRMKNGRTQPGMSLNSIRIHAVNKYDSIPYCLNRNGISSIRIGAWCSCEQNTNLTTIRTSKMFSLIYIIFSTDYLISDPWTILYPPSFEQNHPMFLQACFFSWNISYDCLTIV